MNEEAWKAAAYLAAGVALVGWLCAFLLVRALGREEARRKEYARLYRQLLAGRMAKWEMLLTVKLVDKYTQMRAFKELAPNLQKRILDFRNRMSVERGRPPEEDYPAGSMLRDFKHDERGVKEIEHL